jgi:hypothetical protein
MSSRHHVEEEAPTKETNKKKNKLIIMVLES